LTSGVALEYAKETEENGKKIFHFGRIIVAGLPNGIAFNKLAIHTVEVAGTGTLLHVKEDVREFEEIADQADRDA